MKTTQIHSIGNIAGRDAGAPSADLQLKPHMKTILSLFAVFLLVALPLRGAEPATARLVIGLSPFTPQSQQAALKKSLFTLLLERAPAGTQIRIWDAWNLAAIAELEVPALKADSPAARAIRMRDIGKLSQWFSGLSNAAPSNLRETGLLKVPEWLELAGSHATYAPQSFLLIGSPLYQNLAEPSFSMIEARYPSDGHLAGTASDSVFGLAEKRSHLAKSAVHWCYLSERVWANDLHRTAVTRFWGLFVAGQGGILAAFQADLASATTRALAPNSTPCGMFRLDPDQEKLEMRTAAPRAVPVWLREVGKPSIASPKTNVTPVVPLQPVAKPAAGESEPSPRPSPVGRERETGDGAASVREPATVATAPAGDPGPTLRRVAVVPPLVAEPTKGDGGPSPQPSPVGREREAGADAPSTPEPAAAPGESAGSAVDAKSKAGEGGPSPQPSPVGREREQIANPVAPPNPLPFTAPIGTTGVGIAWSAPGTDLDLYVKASPRAHELYYRNTISAEGRYFRDYRNRNVDLDYEYVELKQSVNITELEVWVNYYSGKAPTPEGKVCMHFNGRTFVGGFKLAASRGNHAGDSRHRDTSPYWVRLNVLELVNGRHETP